MSTTNLNINNSLKDYYIQLKKLHDKTLKIINGIQVAFKSYSSHVNIQFDDDSAPITIPSFLYLENKLEEMENSFNYLINVPSDGETWFTKNSEMYKLNVVQSNVLPAIPSIEYNYENLVNIEQNNFFKDLIFPKTSIRLDISNLGSNIHEVYVKKIVLQNQELIDDIFNDNELILYTDYKEKLYLAENNVDYLEYDSRINVPINQSKYDSKFNIVTVKESYIDDDKESSSYNSLLYKIKFDTLYYYNIYDHSISYKLKEGDLLTLNHKYGIYKVKQINEYPSDIDTENNIEYEVILEETNGHVLLETYDVNEDMFMTLYGEVVNTKNLYIDILLDENPYVIIFVSAIYNNIKSNWSNALKLNLNNIKVQDGSQKISYIEYYNKYCTNIGDLITSISKVTYNQIDEYTNEELKELTTGSIMQGLVTQTLYKDNAEVLTITPINLHLVDDDLSNNLANLHKQKIELSNNLSNINSNINSTFNQLTNTDFSQDTSITQLYLKDKLTTYYNERLSNQQQLISIINNIDLIKNDIVGYDDIKFRIRGVTNASDVDENGIESEIVSYLKETYGEKCELIGLEVEYKYKNIHNNTTTLQNNFDTLFTDWVRVNNIEKQRYLKFDRLTNKYTIDFINYNTNTNIIKWNQVDIPIKAGEDVIIRIRYKYNIGQPFINLYTPWSDNITITYTDTILGSSIDISSILQQNSIDLHKAQFMEELINGGYQDHINNKIIDNSQVYYHMPENIYSGFNTAENKFISLKDKLLDIDNDINEYKLYINNELNSEYKVFLQDGENLIELNKNTINFVGYTHPLNITDTFVKKTLNLVIKNTGTTPINLYSIFPGNIDIPLIHSNIDYYINSKQISNYERVPLLMENIINPRESVFEQVLGQWIYFRYDNPFTKQYLYSISQSQDYYDSSVLKSAGNQELSINYNLFKNYIQTDDKQLLLANRNTFNDYNQHKCVWGVLGIDFTKKQVNINEELTQDINYYTSDNISKFIYNNMVLKYEHMKYVSKNQELYFDNNTMITTLFKENANLLTNIGFNSINDIYGMFLIPELESKSQIICDTQGPSSKLPQSKKLNIGESISIPILFEYFLDVTKANTIYKTLSFSLQTSLTKEIDNYMLKVQISNNINVNDNIINKYVSLLEQTTID